MTSGPFGGPRPFANEKCKLCIAYQVIGRPREDEAEKYLKLEDELQSNVRGHFGDLYFQKGLKSRNSNTVVIVVPIEKAVSPSRLDEWDDRIRRKIKDIIEGDIYLSAVRAGDPEMLVRGSQGTFHIDD